MANMLIDDRERYPHLWNWMGTDLPTAFSKPEVLAAFTHYSQLSEVEARTAVEHTDTLPWIHVRKLTPDGSADVDGRFQPAVPGRIMLAIEVAQNFETASGMPDAQRFLQAKVLHEMVHWGRCQKGIDDTGESGVSFEKDAYGDVVRRFWTEAPAAGGVPPTSRGGSAPAHPADVPRDAPRGLRNNNPGNMKINAQNRSDPWLGQLPPEQETDGTFLQFSEMKFGIRAIARCLRSYQTKIGVRTIGAMSARWAPSVDNNLPGQYAETVLQYCEGVATSVDETLDFTDANTSFGLIRGIIVAENGDRWAKIVADDVVHTGIDIERTA